MYVCMYVCVCMYITNVVDISSLNETSFFQKVSHAEPTVNFSIIYRSSNIGSGGKRLECTP
jgi:hypothetical protein